VIGRHNSTHSFYGSVVVASLGREWLQGGWWSRGLVFSPIHVTVCTPLAERIFVARRSPLLLFCLILPLAADGLEAQAATVIIQESTIPQWRVVAAPEVSGPRSTVIPAQTAVLQRQDNGRAGETAILPADAEVAAAPIRPSFMIRPSLAGGLPTGFVGGWGDYFLSASAGTAGNLRPDLDASFNLGFALGDPERLVGVDVYLGIGSFKNLNANGAFGASVGRLLVNNPTLQLGVAGGVIDAYSYGTEANPQPINGYGAITAALPLRRRGMSSPRLVQFTLGGGGSSFAAIDTSYVLSNSGMFGAAGVELLENLGLSVGVSGRSTNVVLSWIPLRTVPIFVNLTAADVASTTPWGTIGVLTIGWGDSLKNGYVTK